MSTGPSPLIPAKFNGAGSNYHDGIGILLHTLRDPLHRHWHNPMLASITHKYQCLCACT
ncbi:hypothetical protein C8R48DRAFT_723114 [Suillus tomentosus]|nr:hypothetical protein C8R48DRAFT_723114 [Suillus tomentosus]